MKKKFVICISAIVIIAVAAVIMMFNYGIVGISDDKINSEQEKTVTWNPGDYTVIGKSTAEDGSLYAGIIYLNDLSDAKYFIYVNRKGFPFGWHFLQGGTLTELDGLREFDCGEYGSAYFALNSEYDIQKIVLPEGSTPPFFDNTNYPIVEESKQTIHFYDKNGNLIEPSVIKVID